jgi:hypothetical protein
VTDDTAPEEEFWDRRGHRVHLDRYRNPDAQAKVVLHHGVGADGRQMTLILGARWLGAASRRSPWTTSATASPRPDTTRHPQAHVAGSRRSAGSGRWTPRGR